jgi:3-hydroxyisobutyrate dehydrogenase
VVVDTSTVAPGTTRSLAQLAAGTGRHLVDACILGNGHHARQGELRFMVGGDQAEFERVQPLLSMLGKEVTHVGDHGLGASMKILLNMLMGIQMQALAEAVVFGRQAGLPPEVVLQTIAASGFSSPVMKFKCGVMQRRAFAQPDFRLALMRKDLGLIRGEAQRLGVTLPAAEGAYSVLTAAVQQGYGDLDCAAVLAYMEQIAGVEEGRP